MNKILLYICFFIGTLITATLYILGSYYFRYGQNNNQLFIKIYLISICLGIISYSVKIPVFYYFGNNLSVMLINIIYLIMTFVIVLLYSKYILNENINMYTYIILIIIVLLMLLNTFLDYKYAKKIE